MKSYLIILFFTVTSLNSRVVAQETRSEQKFIRNFNLGVQWFEIGKLSTFKQKRIESFNYGLDKYMNNPKGEMSTAIFGLGVYFRDRIGIEAIFSNHSWKSDNQEYKEYLSNKYPGYLLPQTLSGYSASNSGFGLRLCYRKHLKHFFIEPKFQLMFNSFYDPFNSFNLIRLKEIGTNQYIEYTMTKEELGSDNSYHLLLNIAKRFNPFKSIAKLELGVMGEFMISPIHRTISITETPYGQIGVTNTETIKLLNPAINVALTLKVFIEHRE